MNTIRIEDVPVKRHGLLKHPPSLDLSKKITKPINQGLCGSCWAISTSQCLRDRINGFRNTPIPNLSFQYIIDCAHNCVTFQGRQGCALNCNGGFLVTSYNFLQKRGTTREDFHPNRHSDEKGEDHIDGVGSSKSSCPSNVGKEILYTCNGFYNVHLFADTFGITNARMKALSKTPEQLKANADNIAEEIHLNGPVAVCFNMFSDFKAFWLNPNSASIIYEIGWQLPYETRQNINPVGNVEWTTSTGPYGIFFKTGHSVSIVGYGVAIVEGRSVPYWICRNSWGTPGNTHNAGFFKIRKGINCSAIEGDVCACSVDASLANSFSSFNLFNTLAPAGAPIMEYKQSDQQTHPMYRITNNIFTISVYVCVILAILACYWYHTRNRNKVIFLNARQLGGIPPSRL